MVFAFIIALPAFFTTVSFTAALTPDEAIERGKPLPPGWTAGVMNHGEYYRWWTIREKPLLFGISLFALVAGVLFLWGAIFWIWKKDWRSRSIDPDSNISQGGGGYPPGA